MKLVVLGQVILENRDRDTKPSANFFFTLYSTLYSDKILFD